MRTAVFVVGAIVLYLALVIAIGKYLKTRSLPYDPRLDAALDEVAEDWGGR
jgi:hypothetical protein